MKTFLLWRYLLPREEERPEAAVVGLRLQQIFSPLYRRTPELSIRQQDVGGGCVVLHLPICDWKRPFFENDDSGWAQAIDYPLNAGGVLASEGFEFQHDNPLLALSAGLEEKPENLLSELAPPFSLIWFDRQCGEVSVQNDGLGQAQLFEYNDGRIWALSNRIMAFKAIGITPQPLAEEWAVRSTLGWFPMAMTGFRGIRHVPPATRFRLGADGVAESHYHVLSRWLHPEERSEEEWLEIARLSVQKVLVEARRHWEKPWAGLTGGWDSRATVSSLLNAGCDFRARVKGHPDAPDVSVATELARLAGIGLEVDQQAELPGSDAEECRQSILRSLLWQAGHADTEKHKTMFAAGRRLHAGRINIMGQHGELGRGSLYAESVRALRNRGGPVNSAMIIMSFPGALFNRRPGPLRRDLFNFVRDAIETAFKRAEWYDLSGYLRLDFFYLFECTRRRSAGSLSGQDGLVVAPFLNPDFIRACFGAAGLEKEKRPFHRYMIERNVPAWSAVDFAAKRSSTNPANLYYDLSAYWETIGAPVVSSALQNGGFWAEVFDQQRARELPRAAPDDLTMMALLPDALAGEW